MADFKDVLSFLNQLKSKRYLKILHCILRISLFLSKQNPYCLFMLTYRMRATDIAIIMQALFQILFDGYSCVRKMRHLLLADFEDVSSFLNQLKSTRYLKILHGILRMSFSVSKQIESVLFIYAYI